MRGFLSCLGKLTDNPFCISIGNTKTSQMIAGLDSAALAAFPSKAAWVSEGEE